LSLELAQIQPALILSELGGDLGARLQAARQSEKYILGRMIALQEELDWYCYGLYGLVDKALWYQDVLPEIDLGQRAFEILLARSIDSGESDSVW
ncbi:DUF7008 domain-containing protein, partial [Pseudomonas aeruginosa]